MEISVCGKGGSGKSTIVALLANECRARGYRVLVIDSDESNSGLFRMLGFDRPPMPLMELVGGRKGLKEKMGQPNILEESRIGIKDIPTPHLLTEDGLMLASIGKILQSLEGCACPMGVLSREFLKKLALEHDEIVLVDMEAGIEHFGRGVETSVDGVLIVVEPSFESLELAGRVKDLAAGSGISHIWAVLNRVPSDNIVPRLKTELSQRGLPVAGCIYSDPDIFQSSLEGSVINKGKATLEIKGVLNCILGES